MLERSQPAVRLNPNSLEEWRSQKNLRWTRSGTGCYARQRCELAGEIQCGVISTHGLAAGIRRGKYERLTSDSLRGATKIGPISIPWAQLSQDLSILDGFFLAGSLYAVVRDPGRPAVTDEPHVLEIVGCGYLAGASRGAVFLYLKTAHK